METPANNGTNAYALPAQQPHLEPPRSNGHVPLPSQQSHPTHVGSAPNWTAPHMKSAPQPGYISALPIMHAKNEWEVRLLDCCCTPVHSLMALFFPYLSAAYTAHWANRTGIAAGLFFFLTYSATAVASIENAAWVIPPCSALYLMGVLVLRHIVRDVYRIRGSSIGDFFASFCCSCCALAQMSAHTARIKAQRAAATLPAYYDDHHYHHYGDHHHYHYGGGAGKGKDEEEWLRRDERENRSTDSHDDKNIDANYRVLE